VSSPFPQIVKHSADLVGNASLTDSPPLPPEEDWLPRICVIVPALNEAESVGNVVESVHSSLAGVRVLVVDDGSSDDTTERAILAGAHVITLPINLGIGGAMQTGYRYALRHGFDVAVQVDGDAQHRPQEVSRLLAPLVAGAADIVVGSRWIGRGSYRATTQRRIGMRLLAALVRWRTHTTVTDTTSGFRAIGPPALELFARDYPTDFPEVESLVVAARHGLRVQEVGVQMAERSHGRSSIAGLRSVYYMLRVTMILVVDRLNRERS
jgi:glycosyltransferase involved in cell wall biosynthesis